MLEQASLLLSQLNSLFEDREKQLAEDQAELKQQIELFEQEKKLMATVPVADNDVLSLNVAGTLLTTKRSTLTQAEGSALAARFNGRWEQCLDRDDQGRIFLDFDPYCFQQILFYLRSRALLSSAEAAAALPEVESCRRTAYIDLVKYLALEEYMGYSGVAALQFVQASPGVEIMGERQKAKVTTSGSNYRTVITGSSLGNVCFLKCKICQVNHWMFVGIGADIALDGQNNQSASNAYGWGSGKQQYTRGQERKSSGARWTNGDWVLIKADFLAGKLSMVSRQVSTPLTMSLEVPANLQDQYTFQLILFDCNDQVELLPVTAEEQQLLP